MKKGKIMMGMIITLVVFIFSAFIIFMVWKNLNPRDIVEDEVCHESIILRSTFNVGPIQAGKSLPLNCRTKKLCLSIDDEDCGKLFSSKNSPVEKIDVSGVDVKKNVMDEIGNAFYDCQSVVGEGKLDFLPHGFVDETYCLICARFDASEDVRDELKKVDVRTPKVKGFGYGEYYENLESLKDNDGRSYLSFIYPGWTSWEHARTIYDATKSKDKSKNLGSFENWGLDFDTSEEVKGYAIVVIVNQKGTWEAWAGAGGVLAGGVLVAVGIGSIPFSGPVGVAIASFGTQVVVSGSTAASSAIFAYSYPQGEYRYTPPAIIPYDAKTLRGLECDEFEFAA